MDWYSPISSTGVNNVASIHYVIMMVLVLCVPLSVQNGVECCSILNKEEIYGLNPFIQNFCVCHAVRDSYRKDRARQQRAMKELPNLLMASLSGDETSFLSSKTADIAPLTIPLAISERKRE